MKIAKTFWFFTVLFFPLPFILGLGNNKIASIEKTVSIQEVRSLRDSNIQTRQIIYNEIYNQYIQKDKGKRIN